MIELQSDLGGGKTTFVQGLAAGLGYAGPVTSPTFTLSNVYQLASGLQIHHYDMYRLEKAGVLAQELAEAIDQPGVITVIEWAGIVESSLPADRLTVAFEVTAESARTLVLTSGGSVSAALLRKMSV